MVSQGVKRLEENMSEHQWLTTDLVEVMAWSEIACAGLATCNWRCSGTLAMAQVCHRRQGHSRAWIGARTGWGQWRWSCWHGQFERDGRTAEWCSVTAGSALMARWDLCSKIGACQSANQGGVRTGGWVTGRRCYVRDGSVWNDLSWPGIEGRHDRENQPSTRATVTWHCLGVKLSLGGVGARQGRCHTARRQREQCSQHMQQRGSGAAARKCTWARAETRCRTLLTRWSRTGAGKEWSCTVFKAPTMASQATPLLNQLHYMQEDASSLPTVPKHDSSA